MSVSIRLVHNGLDGLERDLIALPAKASVKFETSVRGAAVSGNRLAARLGGRQAGEHGKHYGAAHTVERLGTFRYEYGPDSAKKQGGMAFDTGSRNQPPHPAMGPSADVAGADLRDRIDDDVDGLFW